MKKTQTFGKRRNVVLAFVMSLLLLGGTTAAIQPVRPVSAAGDPALTEYTSEFDSVQGVLDASSQLNEQIGDEGFVLLKNKAGNLPFGSAVKNISVFGKNSVNPVYSGTGSSGGTSGSTVGIIDSLKNAGFKVNPTLETFYKDNSASGPVRPSMGFASYNYNSYFPTAETPQTKYTDEVKASYDNFNDAAVIVLSRTGGEGTDLPRSSYVKQADEGKVPTADNARAYPTRDELADDAYKFYGGEGRTSDPHQHYLELDDNEKALINEVTAEFGKVVLILNTANVMQLDKELVVDNDKVQSILWAPGGGQNAFSAIGKILNGTVNPSGRTTDTFAADFTKDPTWFNFANNNIGYYANGTAGNQYLNEDGSLFETNFNDFLGIEEVEYEEGIYLGYKYYETRAYTEDGKQGATKDAWYSANVNYPFGYGLSYTAFDWSVGEPKMSTSSLTEKTVISIDVKVTNTGVKAGKDVVQVYFSAPYTSGQTEKSHVVLGGFAKTKKLRPGESQSVTVSFDAFDMASFDVYDKDGDGHKGYELDKGQYKLFVGKNSHHAWTNGVEKTLAELTADINIDKDPITEEDIALRFADSNTEMSGHVLSRSDFQGTFPTTPTEDDLMREETWLNKFAMPLAEGATAANAVIDPAYDTGKPWYAETAPSFRAETEAYSASNPAPVQLKDMLGVDYDDERWNAFVEQLTVNQAYAMMAATRFESPAQDAVGAPSAGHSDGPLGLTGAWVGGGNSLLSPMGGLAKFGFATETLVGCTWNVELARRQGELVGDFGLWAHVIGWYAPGGNIHRSPFSGRNFEYYSEDSTLSAYMLSNVVAGARSKGMITFMKHFVLNDAECNRDTDGLATWADEQTMRENYFKPFEWAVKKGGSNGAMSSFNRIGFEWAGACYSLLTELLRSEWGFKGVVITDAHGAGQGCMNGNQMIRAGNDMSLDSRENSIARIVNSQQSNTATQLTALRNSVKHIFYTTLNSSAMTNGISDYGKQLSYKAADVTANKNVSVAPGEAVDINVGDGSEGSVYTVITGSLPEGVTFNGTSGTIKGTVSHNVKAGDYSVVIAKIAAGAGQGENYLNSAFKAGWGQTEDGRVTFTVTVTADGITSNIKESISVTGVEKIATIGSVDYYAIIMSDGSESYFTVINGQQGAPGTNGVDGTNGTDGLNGKDGTDGKDGATGAATAAVILASCALAAVIALAVVYFILKKKKA